MLFGMVQGNFPEDKRTSETALLFLQLIMRISKHAANYISISIIFFLISLSFSFPVKQNLSAEAAPVADVVHGGILVERAEGGGMRGRLEDKRFG